MKEKKPFKTGPYSLYKRKYIICFYDKTGEIYINCFNNVREILQWQGKPITRQNVNYLNVQIYRAINWHEHQTRILTGEQMTVWLVPENDNEEIDMKGVRI